MARPDERNNDSTTLVPSPAKFCTSQSFNKVRRAGLNHRFKTCPELKNDHKGHFLILAGPTGFEPAISSVTGRRDRPTSLRAQE